MIQLILRGVEGIQAITLKEWPSLTKEKKRQGGSLLDQDQMSYMLANSPICVKQKGSFFLINFVHLQ